MGKIKYLLGLDVGTNSVGWCLTDENYKIVKKQGKALWGVRLFDDANSAKDRRIHRTERRRLQRRKLRLHLLRNIFKTEISKEDNTFFLRLDESKLHNENKKTEIQNSYPLFNDKNYSDKDFYKKYHTIWHLIKELIEEDKKTDIRKLYLVCSYLIKYRGHFLIEGEFKITDIDNVLSLLKNINETLKEHDDLSDEFNIDENKIKSFFEDIKNIKGKTDLQEKLTETLLIENKPNPLTKDIIKLISGSEVNFKKHVDSDENIKIKVRSNDFNNKLEECRALYQNSDYLFDIVVYCKEISDFIELNRVLHGKKYLYEVMIERYETHKKQLRELKKYLRSKSRELYNQMFGSPITNSKDKNKPLNNYSRYVGVNEIGKDKDEQFDKCTRDEFYDFVKDLFGIKKSKDKDIDTEGLDDTLKYILAEIKNSTYLPKQNSTDNGIFPNQLFEEMLKNILEKQAKYYAFLNERDSEAGDISNLDKILQLLTFRVPYYVGPLYSNSNKPELNKFSWSIRNKGYEKESVTPWNFNKVIDEDNSAVAFIERMQRKCTYLSNENCLPKQSLIYSEFEVLNELNNILVENNYIDPSLKEKLFNELYLTKAKVTKKDLEKWFKKEKNVPSVGIVTAKSHDENIELNGSMSSYIDFVSIFGKAYVDTHKDQIEEIIKEITVFSEKKILRKRLKDVYKFNKEQVDNIINRCNYKKRGRLSKKLLTELEAVDNNGEYCSIIKLLRTTTQNFQQIIHNEQYNYINIIEEYKIKYTQDKILTASKAEIDYIKDYIDLAYVSPLMKRPLIQAWKIILELEQIIKHPIDEFYIECTREHVAEKKGKKTATRKELLKQIFDKALKEAKTPSYHNDMEDLNKKLESIGNDKLKSQRVYLYFTQLGRCLYTGKKLDFDDVLDPEKTDIDHIYPRSKVKDDSLLNNKVLVLTTENRNKSDNYPYSYPNWSEPNFKPCEFFKILNDNGFINNEKYNRLKSKDELSESVLYDFVNRQLVVTNQATKALKDSLTLFRKDSKVIFSKASIVSDFRNEFKLIKCREANNYHHAHDAFLNIVVGRTVDRYFKSENLRDRLYILNKNKQTLNPDKIFTQKGSVKSFDDKEIWDASKYIKIIKNTLYERYDIFVTTRAYVAQGLFSQTSITSAKVINDGLPIKKGLQLKKYGGFSDLRYGSYLLVKPLTKDGETGFSFEPLPNLLKNDLDVFKSSLLKKNKEIEQISFVSKEPLKINTVICKSKSKFCITGKTNDSYVIKNLVESNFSYEQLVLIRLNEKAYKQLDAKGYIKKINDNIPDIDTNKTEYTVAEARSKANEEQKIDAINSKQLFEILINKLSSAVKTNGILEFYVNFKKIVKKINDNKAIFETLNIYQKIILNHELLKLFKCDRKTSDLRFLGLPKESGTLTLNKNLNLSKHKGIKIIFESVTGFYTKTFWQL